MASPLATQLHFDRGTLAVPALDEVAREAVEHLLVEDTRSGGFRAPASRYRDVVLTLKQAGLPFSDEARAFEPIELAIADPFEPFPHQAEALEKWWKAGRRGIVELPTGAGKTLLAVLAIAKTQRPTLVVVPTLELLVQWQRTLEQRLGIEVGTIGGGTRDVKDVTVITYDSAQWSFAKLLLFLALLSVNLGVINLLPIPVLDGGQMVLLLCEKVKGSRLSERFLQNAQLAGFVAILALMAYVTFNDILRFT